MDEGTKDVIITEEDLAAAEQNNYDEYSIYKMIKEDGSIIFAVGSICVTVLAACFRLASYLYHLSYLRYWNVDSTLISEPGIFWLENIGLSFLLVVTSPVYSAVIFKIINEWVGLKEATKTLTKINSKMIKTEKRKERKVSRQKKALENERGEHSWDYYSDKQQMLTEHLNETEDAQKKLLEKKSEIKYFSKRTRIIYGIKTIAISLLFGAVYTLACLRILDSLANAIVLASIMIFLLFCITIINVFVTRKTNKADSISDKQPIQQGIGNNRIVWSIVFALVLCAVFLLFEYHSGNREASTQKDFNLIYVQDTPYAVIATDCDYLIAEEMKISEDNKSAIIYSDKVIIIAKESGPVLKKSTFDKAPIVKTKEAGE